MDTVLSIYDDSFKDSQDVILESLKQHYPDCRVNLISRSECFDDEEFLGWVSVIVYFGDISHEQHSYEHCKTLDEFYSRTCWDFIEEIDVNDINGVVFTRI